MSPEFGDVSWSWKSRDSDVQKATMRIMKNPTLDELIEHLREVAPDMTPGNIRVSGGVVWEREAEAETKAERARWRAQGDARTQEWELKTLARLIQKYGAPDVAEQERAS